MTGTAVYEDLFNDEGQLVDNALDVIDAIYDFEFGGRMFSCQDPEGYVWVFSSHDHWG